MCHLEERRKIQNYSINITFSIEKEEYRVGSPQMSSLISAYSAVFHLKALMVFLSISSFFIRAISNYLGDCIEQQTMKAKRQSKGQVAQRLLQEVTHLAFHSDQIISFNLGIEIWHFLSLLMADRKRGGGGETCTKLWDAAGHERFVAILLYCYTLENTD